MAMEDKQQPMSLIDFQLMGISLIVVELANGTAFLPIKFSIGLYSNLQSKVAADDKTLV